MGKNLGMRMHATGRAVAVRVTRGFKIKTMFRHAILIDNGMEGETAGGEN